MTTIDQVRDIIRTDTFRERATNFDRRELIRMANTVGPPMHLLHWQTLDAFGRLPRFDEGYTEDALAGIDRFGAPIVEIFMVSHRWLRPSLDPQDSHPDTEHHDKARALNEFSRWRRHWVQTNHALSPEIFFWLDYCCLDQDNPLAVLPMLPLWVACCERFLRFETDDYHERAWCRLETLLSYTFSFADHHTVIDGDFYYRWPHSGTRADAVLADPKQGLATDPQDVAQIGPLVEMAAEFLPVAVNQKTGDTPEQTILGATRVKCFRL